MLPGLSSSDVTFTNLRFDERQDKICLKSYAS